MGHGGRLGNDLAFWAPRPESAPRLLGRRSRLEALARIELNNTEALLVALDGLEKNEGGSFGRLVAHDYPLINLDRFVKHPPKGV